MLITWLFAVFLAEGAEGQINRPNEVPQINQASRIAMVPLSDAAMTCTREGDHLVCVIPLDAEAAHEPQSVMSLEPKARTYGPSQSTLATPGPEALTQLKAAAANIELAKLLMPQATTPEEAVLAEQLLYRAKEQYRTARALLHTVQGDLHRAPDPFDSDKDRVGSGPMALCQGDVTEDCNTATP